MNARHVMTHRTTIERNTPASDGGGGYSDDWTTVASDVHCRAFPMRVRSTEIGAVGSGVVGGVTRPGIMELTAVLVPRSTDVTEGDRLDNITDRLGNVLYTGPGFVDAVGVEPDHHRLMLRAVK